MTETFEVGQKVQYTGPYTSPLGFTRYVVKLEGGAEVNVRDVQLSAIPETPAAKFKVGDTVRSGSTKYTVVGGPFRGPAHTWYAVNADGRDYQSNESYLTTDEPEPDTATVPVKVGDVVRILKDGANSADVAEGDLLIVSSVRALGTEGVYVQAVPGARLSRWYIGPQNYAKVPANEVAAHDGKVYDLTARYCDNDGDYWTFKDVDGTVRGAYGSSNVDRTANIHPYSETLQEAIRDYGPLTRV